MGRQTKLERLQSEYRPAIEYLTTDSDTGEDTGHLLVPCSRYGRNSSDCAPVAVVAAVIAARVNGEDIGGECCEWAKARPCYYCGEQLNYMMGLTVNDSDDIAYLVREYGPSELGISWRTLREQLLA